ncbi:MAG: toxin-antitoxin system YwqK family antitoxin [Mucilaginibacter sp.]
MQQIKKKRLVLAVTSIVVVLILLKVENFKIFYFQLFKKNEIIAHYNKYGKLDGQYLSYLNGRIYVKTYFENGLRTGCAVEYYQNGQIKNERFFKKGKEIGIENAYYENGKLDYKAHWQNGKHYGSQWHWLRDGQLQIYNTYDIVDLFYYSEYDETGRLKKILGNIISPNLYTKNTLTDSTVLLEDKGCYPYIKDLYIPISTPPNLTSEIEVNINKHQINPTRVIDNTIIVSNAFSNVGTFRIDITGKLIDSNNRPIRKDSIGYTIIRNK